MHQSVMDFLRESIQPEEVRDRRVLDVGSFDVNGSARKVIEPLGPRDYVGVDIREGPGVDLLVPAEHLLEVFGPESFDVVVSTEMLEHCELWRDAVRNMKGVLASRGVLLVTARGPGMMRHDHPADWWRYTVGDFQDIFGDMVIVHCREDTESPGVLLKARRPRPLEEIDVRRV